MTNTLSCDTKYISFKTTPSSEVKSAVYKTLAEYMQTYVKTGVDMGKIDLSKSSIEISADLIKKIVKKINGGNEFKRTYNNYTVSLQFFGGFGNSSAGQLYVNSK